MEFKTIFPLLLALIAIKPCWSMDVTFLPPRPEARLAEQIRNDLLFSRVGDTRIIRMQVVAKRHIDLSALPALAEARKSLGLQLEQICKKASARDPSDPIIASEMGNEAEDSTTPSVLYEKGYYLFTAKGKLTYPTVKGFCEAKGLRVPEVITKTDVRELQSVLGSFEAESNSWQIPLRLPVRGAFISHEWSSKSKDWISANSDRPFRKRFAQYDRRYDDKFRPLGQTTQDLVIDGIPAWNNQTEWSECTWAVRVATKDVYSCSRHGPGHPTGSTYYPVCMGPLSGFARRHNITFKAVVSALQQIEQRTSATEICLRTAKNLVNHATHQHRHFVKWWEAFSKASFLSEDIFLESNGSVSIRPGSLPNRGIQYKGRFHANASQVGFPNLEDYSSGYLDLLDESLSQADDPGVDYASAQDPVLNYRDVLLSLEDRELSNSSVSNFPEEEGSLPFPGHLAKLTPEHDEGAGQPLSRQKRALPLLPVIGGLVGSAGLEFLTQYLLRKRINKLEAKVQRYVASLSNRISENSIYLGKLNFANQHLYAEVGRLESDLRGLEIAFRDLRSAVTITLFTFHIQQLADGLGERYDALATQISQSVTQLLGQQTPPFLFSGQDLNLIELSLQNKYQLKLDRRPIGMKSLIDPTSGTSTGQKPYTFSVFTALSGLSKPLATYHARAVPVELDSGEIAIRRAEPKYFLLDDSDLFKFLPMTEAEYLKCKQEPCALSAVSVEASKFPCSSPHAMLAAIPPQQLAKCPWEKKLQADAYYLDAGGRVAIYAAPAGTTGRLQHPGQGPPITFKLNRTGIIHMPAGARLALVNGPYTYQAPAAMDEPQRSAFTTRGSPTIQPLPAHVLRFFSDAVQQAHQAALAVSQLTSTLARRFLLLMAGIALSTAAIIILLIACCSLGRILAWIRKYKIRLQQLANDIGLKHDPAWTDPMGYVQKSKLSRACHRLSDCCSCFRGVSTKYLEVGQDQAGSKTPEPVKPSPPLSYPLSDQPRYPYSHEPPPVPCAPSVLRSNSQPSTLNREPLTLPVRKPDWAPASSGKWASLRREFHHTLSETPSGEAATDTTPGTQC